MTRLLLGFCLLVPAVVAASAELPPAPAPRTAESEVAKCLPRGMHFAEHGRVDVFVAATAEWDLKPDDDRLWVPAVDLGRRLIKKANLEGDRKPNGCPSSFKDYATYKRLMPPKFKRLEQPYVQADPQKVKPPPFYYQEAVQAPGFSSLTGITNNLIVSRGDVESGKGIHQSVIFANGDVTTRGAILSCIIVCDGDVTVADRNIGQSLVIARGNITVKGYASEATLIAGGKVTAGAPRNPDNISTIKENEPNPLSYVTFFELSRVGLKVKVAEGAVTVEAVAAKSESEKAGLKTGDVILEANSKKPADAESLRRLLRDALAIGDATVKLQRGKETLTVKVSLPD
jgi:hypothetical protein